MKILKWIPVHQPQQKGGGINLNRRRLFEADENRANLGMDEDSNMSNISTASDSQDGVAPAPDTAATKEGRGFKFFFFTQWNSDYTYILG